MFFTNTSQVLLCVEITLYNKDFALPMKRDDYDLFVHNFSKNVFSFFSHVPFAWELNHLVC